MRDVGAAVGLGDREAGDGLAAQHRSDDALDEVVCPRCVTALTPPICLVDHMGQRDAVAEEARDHPTAATGLKEGLGHHDHVDEVATRSSDPFGEADPEDARRRGLAMQIPGQLTRLLPVGQVRGDLPGREVGDQGAQGAAFGSGVGVGSMRGGESRCGRHSASLGKGPGPAADPCPIQS